MLTNITQHPAESKRYEVDYSSWLDVANGELLSGVNVTIDPISNPQLRVQSALDASQKRVILTIFDGETGTQYEVGILVTTTFNQRDRECMGVTILEQC